MNITAVFPSPDDLSKLVNDHNFESEAIEFQKHVVAKYLKIKWDSYLDKLHFIYTNYINPITFSEEFIDNQFNPNSKKLFIPTLVIKHTKIEMQKEIKSLNDIYNYLPKKTQLRITEFEKILSILFFKSVLEINCHEKTVIDLLNIFLKDATTQYTILNSPLSNHLKKANSLVEAFSLPNFYDTYNQYKLPNFFFPNNRIHLKQLHDSLVTSGFITENPDFEKLFAKEYSHRNGFNKTKWLKKKTQLFYLIYRLNDGEKPLLSLNLVTIASQLFSFEKSTDFNILQTSLNQVIKKFRDKDYIQKNMSSIVEIIDQYKL